jgi:hypothetical protein
MRTRRAGRCLPPTVGIVQEMVHELGMVCRELREKAGLDIERDMRFYTRADPRTIEAFEAGRGGTRKADALVEGYAAALNISPSEIGQMAIARLREQDRQAEPPRVLPETARALEQESADRSETPAEGTSRRAE